jgi:hypothetical protein
MPQARIWMRLIGADAADRCAAAVAAGGATRAHLIGPGAFRARNRLRHVSNASMKLATLRCL